VRALEVVDIFKALRAKIVEKIYIIVISMCRVPSPAGEVPRSANQAKMTVTEAAMMRINKQLCWASRRVTAQGGD
jgi:hypothetical protein